MQDGKKRWAKFLEIVVDTDPGAPAKAGFQIGQLIRNAEHANFASRRPKEGARKHVRVRHAHWFQRGEESFVALLISQADADAIDAAYEDIATAEVERFPKEDGQGYRTEAHLVIWLKGVVNQVGAIKYFAALEETRGLPVTSVRDRLNGLLRSTNHVEMQDKTGEAVKVKPLIIFNGFLSKRLMEEIDASGRLDYFDLIKEIAQANGIDEDEQLVPTKAQLKLQVVGERAPGILSRLLPVARAKALKEDFDKIRIHYTDSNNRPAVATLEDLEQDAKDKMISRSCLINLNDAMNYDHEEVVPGFAESLADKLLEEFRASQDQLK